MPTKKKTDPEMEEKLGENVEKMTEEKIRNYFNAWQTLCDCDMEGKWLSAECSSEQNSVERN